MKREGPSTGDLFAEGRRQSLQMSDKRRNEKRTPDTRVMKPLVRTLDLLCSGTTQ